MVRDTAPQSVSMSDGAYCRKRLSGVVREYACAHTAADACPHSSQQTDNSPKQNITGVAGVMPATSV